MYEALTAKDTNVTQKDFLQRNYKYVKYTHRPLAAEGCEITYLVVKQDTNYYIIVIVKSDRLQFLEESTMLVRTFNDDVISLKGKLIENDNQTAGLLYGNVFVPITELKSTSQFKINPEQFELLKCGIAKIRLSTIPIEHEKNFKKDVIGNKLYQLYLNVLRREYDF
ncbi:MAG: hypothetical protein J6Y34_03070 [Bacteroidales bacterium]|nr:hypothetical protein [Bacteroidales bacterium]